MEDTKVIFDLRGQIKKGRIINFYPELDKYLVEDSETNKLHVVEATNVFKQSISS